MSGTHTPLAAWPFADMVVAAPETSLAPVANHCAAPHADLLGRGIAACPGRQCRRRDDCPRYRAGGIVWRADLPRLKLDVAAMSDLRWFVARTAPGLEVSRLDDEAVLRQFIRLLDTDRLPICAGFERVERVARAPDKAPPSPEPPPRPPRKAPAPSPVMAATPEPATFRPHQDPVAQAATLVQAARSGVPFCEECAKASRQAAAGG